MKVKMLPGPDSLSGESGINTVIRKYARHLGDFGIELVPLDSDTYDLIAAHAGMAAGNCAVSHLHGLYWTADHHALEWEYRVNARIVESIRSAKIITVPSEWVAETIRRDCRFNPVVVPHGVDWHEWQHNEKNEGYILGYAKNRVGDVCDPGFLTELGNRFPHLTFGATFAPKNRPGNVKEFGLTPHEQFKIIVQRSAVFISPVKETWGIQTIEAMAAGVPVLGYAHGGNVDLIEHGVNGYLAKPGDIDDLAEGLAYCLKYRDVLGANGREVAKRWTWEAACEKVAEVYRLALKPEMATVSVVISVYNKPIEMIRRAIESAKGQTLQPKEIVVVNDGSDNGADIRALAGEMDVVFVDQNNKGVAHARNAGIAKTTSKHVCCIDADDWIEPAFLEVCVKPLEDDRTMGLAYTSLMTHNSDGSSVVSPWPGPFDYDQQIQRHNQVPTCCVFRRIAWERLGGYRQRYAPYGAGSEDAAFWTAIGSIGLGGIKATDEALFNYTAYGGNVHGKEGYTESDWLCMYPWVTDRQHPFASVATPARLSHPVRQYDEPVISVVIPVGPGHESHVVNALDSLEMQHYRRWEAVVVDDTGGQELERVLIPYPYARVFSTGGKRSAGAARNLGVNHARAPFVFFLDADDLLNQADAFDLMLARWNEIEAIIYSDYLDKSTWDMATAVEELGDKLLAYLPKAGQAIIRRHASEYDRDRAIEQPKLDKTNPNNPYYLWCTVSILLPKAWHNAIGGFDEQMDTWEDVDYVWRLARAGYCFERITEPLLLYNFDTGHRREHGLPKDAKSRQRHKSVIKYIRDKYAEIEPKMCNCGGKRQQPATPPTPTEESIAVSNITDSDMVKVEFTPNYIGRRKLIGMATKTSYGSHRRPGDRFLVHKADIAAQPHLFKQIRDHITDIPEDRKPAPKPQPLPSAPERIAESVTAMRQAVKEQPFDLQSLPGINASVARELAKVAKTKADVVALGEDGLKAVSGIGVAKAKAIIEYLT